MPTFHRLKDGRLLFLWSNTTALPEVERIPKRGGEDVFTNRDALHAAISENDGKTWHGFREVILDEHRNKTDYAVTKGSNDRGKHQSEVVQLDNNRVLFSCGQHPLHRKLVIMDVRWLYENERGSDLGSEGTRNWSTHQFVDKIVGHCGYNRTPGAQIHNGALRLLRVEDDRLTNPNQGATWNFPTGHSGGIFANVRLNKGSSGIQICLADRWFNPTDNTVDQFANYVLHIDHEGKTPDGVQRLVPGRTHELSIHWESMDQRTTATLSIDSEDTGLSLPCKHPAQWHQLRALLQPSCPAGCPRLLDFDNKSSRPMNTTPLLILLILSFCRFPSATEPPNLVFILIDDAGIR